MNREDLIREYRRSGASWPALLGVYVLILGTMVASAVAIVA